MKTERLRELTRDELNQKLKDLQEEQFNLRVRLSLQPPDDPLKIRQLRREVARVRTILHEDKTGIRRLGTGKKILD